MIEQVLSTDGNLYQTVIPQEDISLNYRLLNLKEYSLYKKFRDNGIYNEYDCYMRVFERCFLGEVSLLSPNLPAGILISIGRFIMWLSGDCDNHTLANDIDRHRHMTPPDNVFSVMISTILTAMPVYKYEELLHFDRERLLRLFTVAENALVFQNAEYVRAQVKTQEEQPQAHGAPSDIEAENRAIMREMGQFDIEEAERELSRSQLERLEKMRG